MASFWSSMDETISLLIIVPNSRKPSSYGFLNISAITYLITSPLEISVKFATISKDPFWIFACFPLTCFITLLTKFLFILWSFNLIDIRYTISAIWILIELNSVKIFSYIIFKIAFLLEVNNLSDISFTATDIIVNEASVVYSLFFSLINVSLIIGINSLKNLSLNLVANKPTFNLAILYVSSFLSSFINSINCLYIFIKILLKYFGILST